MRRVEHGRGDVGDDHAGGAVPGAELAVHPDGAHARQPAPAHPRHLRARVEGAHRGVPGDRPQLQVGLG